MQVWIGTSGYTYPDWVGPFYPAGSDSKHMLRHYCQHFPLVELNFTFYRLPTPAMLARLADATPDGFQFLVKLPRTLSHAEDPRELPSFRRAVAEMHRRGKLLGLLCQLPQAIHESRQHRAWLETLAGELGDLALAVEFRHRSWATMEVAGWLRGQRLDLVSVDVPAIANLYPSGLVQSSPRVYVRFHSRNRDNWYKTDKERYDYHYDDQALQAWGEALVQAAPGTERALLLFNNCQGSQAVDNAHRMRHLLTGMAPNVTLVDPFAAPEMGPRQRMLFE